MGDDDDDKIIGELLSVFFVIIDLRFCFVCMRVFIIITEIWKLEGRKKCEGKQN